MLNDKLALMSILIFIISCNVYNFINTNLEGSEPKTYYISKSGSDNNSGTSESEAWNSISKINKVIFKSGDIVLFDSSSEFYGNISLNENNCGSLLSKPIKFKSTYYKKATIISHSDSAFKIENCSNIQISNLKIVGNALKMNNNHGIFIENSIADNANLKNINISNLEITGFKEGGITIRSTKKNTGFENVIIQDSKIYGNGQHGISVDGIPSNIEGTYSNQNILISGNLVYQNKGLKSRKNIHSGNGVIIGNSQKVLIEKNKVFDNGKNNTWDRGGPVGIWTWNSDNVLIQFNESYANKTSSNYDGGGFDLDGGVTNSVVQYNYSHDNDGAGFLVTTYWDSGDSLNNVIRYNLSENDGLKNGYAGILILRDNYKEIGKIENLYIYNNTIISGNENSNKIPSSAFKPIGDNLKNITVLNNIWL